jgi:hypothetical protein
MFNAGPASDPGLEVTLPGVKSAAGAEGRVLDVRIAEGAVGACGGLVGNTDGLTLGTGDRMRLWLFDAPAGLSMQVVAIAIVVSESTFEYAVQWTAPVVEFNVP